MEDLVLYQVLIIAFYMLASNYWQLNLKPYKSTTLHFILQ